jgi:hypothetical protein
VDSVQVGDDGRMGIDVMDYRSARAFGNTLHEPNGSPSVDDESTQKGATMDPFVSALEELAEALLAGEDPEEVLPEIAEEHGVPAQALRNRALRAFGPLETYKERQAELKKEREQTARRRDPVFAGASFLAAVASLSPKLSLEERRAEIERLAAEYDVDPSAHKDAIERLRRR